MSQKTVIVTELGETALVLPGLLETALRANDRAKYYMSLIQACRAHAAHPDENLADLKEEREASGEDDRTLDELVARSRTGPDGTLLVPRAGELHERLVESVEQMVAPLRMSRPDLASDFEAYERRFAGLRGRLPAISGDTIPAGYVDAVTRAERNGADSVHLLVMDLHRDLNRIQSSLAEQTLDGAKVYGLTDGDVPLVRAFMRGVNATAALKFNHPGLGTIATRMRDQLVIQNDIGTTEAHVVVVHVSGLTLSFIYTDVHRARLEFFKQLFERTAIEWGERDSSAHANYETSMGRRICKDCNELEELLASLGSKLVFLIDWNRARKRLSRFVKKSDAVATLKWAAEHGYGHRAFLEAGADRLIYSALERAASPQLRYGARLDEVLGKEAAAAFLQAVLRITSEALQQRQSLRLVRDEIEAELLSHIADSQQGLLALAADHAALTVALAHAVRDTLHRLRTSGVGADQLSSVAERAKRWEAKADDIVSRARHAQSHLQDSDAIQRLLAAADNIADAMEEAIFLITLLPDHEPGRRALDSLNEMAESAVASAQEYVKCLEVARDIQRSGGTHDDVQQFLVAVDRVITLEHESDELERRAKAVLLNAADNFRSLHLLSQIAKGLEESVDAVARCALMLRDHIMGEMLVD